MKLKYISATAAVLLLGAAGVSALEKAIVRNVLDDHRVISREIALEKVAPDTWRARVPMAQQTGEGLRSIEILLPEATAKKGDSGYFILPDGRRGFFTRDNGLATGGKPLKVFGIKTARACVAIIVKGMEQEFEPIAQVVDGKYEVFPRFEVAAMGRPPYEDIVVDFVELKGCDADYSGMGRAYRKYQLGRGEVAPLRERVKTRPSLAYAVDTMVMRVKHGSKHEFIAEQVPGVNEPPVHVYHTFEKLKNMIAKLKSLGVEKLEVCSVAWNTRGHDGRYPQLFPVEPAFGGEAKLREAIAEAKRAGYRIFGQTNYTDAYKCADCFDESYLIKRPDGTPLRGGVWAGGRSYEVCQIAMLEKFARKDFQRMKDLGFEGTHHIDVLSAITPRPCFDKRHPATRKDNAKAMNKIGLLAREYFGGFGSECGYDHVANSLDFALYTETFPRWGNQQIIDDCVPLWQIVYHGIILSNRHYATADYNAPDRVKQAKGWPWFALSPVEARLKLYEVAGRPAFYWDKYDDMRRIKAAYDEYQPIKYLQYEFLEKHEQISDSVYRARFSDGSEIITNYGKFPYVYNGETVKAEDYRLFKPTLARKLKNWLGLK